MTRITPIDLEFISRPRFQRRFWRRVVKAPGCWAWTGMTNQAGYGQIEAMIAGRRYVWLAHRVTWTLANGPIPDGLIVKHSCDNPGCCNPAHLSVGTMKENIAEAVQRGRACFDGMKGRKGDAHPAAKFNAAQRASAVAMRFGEGLSYDAIAARIGCEKQSVGRWVREALGP